MSVRGGSAKKTDHTLSHKLQHSKRLVLLTAARVQCHLAGGMKTWGLGATFGTYRTEMLLLVQTL
jgi:hypothetical protein